MTKTKIFTIVFALTSIVLTFVLYRSINSSIEESRRIEAVEKAVIEQLKMIREAQIAYKAVNGSYTSDWDKLTNFVDSGSFYLIEKIEKITLKDYGAEEVTVIIDTIGTSPVKDSIFTAQKYPKFNLKTLAFVPGTNPPVKFNMWADRISKAGIMVDVLEVWDPQPANPNRNEESEFNTKKPLRFGSRANVTVAGNWE